MARIPARAWVSAAVIFALAVFSVFPQAQTQAERRPESKEILKAIRIEDPAARIKELERIKSAYPDSPLQTAIQNFIVAARVELTDDLDVILGLQKSLLQSLEGGERPFGYYNFCLQILQHRSLARFDKLRVTQAVEQYAAEGLKLASDEAMLKRLPPARAAGLKANLANFHIALALAYLNDGRAEKALRALGDFTANGGRPNAQYQYILGDVYAALGKPKEALDGYLAAAGARHKDAVDKARAFWEKVHGSSSGFEAELEGRRRELPFEAERFQPGPGAWKGKTVLAELFTGSECGPCVASDLALDGLLEAYGSQYLAVLEYHLPIPRPDPLMNPASIARAVFYDVKSTPTACFDGELDRSGGGQRTAAESKYKQYAAKVNARLLSEPAVRLKVAASSDGDRIEVRFSADAKVKEADYNLALVQKVERYQGGNGIGLHKMVVRDFLTLGATETDGGRAWFSIEKAEKDAEERLDQSEAQRGFTFPERHSRIDRENLLVVFFLQDRSTKAVLNAAVAPVEK
jgi:tetratricopeptide (TPR) repeat protein